jgi:hypothetical protein
MSHEFKNQEFCAVSPDGEREQARTLLELVTEIYNALEKEKRGLLARDHQPAAGPRGWPPSRREGAP